MIIGTCVCTNGSFTLFDECELIFGDDPCSGEAIVASDDGWNCRVERQGDGHYGFVDTKGKKVSFLVE